MRLINTSADCIEKNHAIRKKHINYILQINKQKKGLLTEATAPIILGNLVDTNDPNSFGFFASAAAKDSGRPLKHLILSFGNASLTWADCESVTNEIITCWPHYQVIAAIHKDIPNRPHCHLLIDCYNVDTGKKMSEGPNDFNNLIFKLNQILMKNDLPKLLQKECYKNLPIFKDSSSELTVEHSCYHNDNGTSQPAPYQFAQAQPYTERDFLLAHKFLFPEMYKKNK